MCNYCVWNEKQTYTSIKLVYYLYEVKRQWYTRKYFKKWCCCNPFGRCAFQWINYSAESHETGRLNVAAQFDLFCEFCELPKYITGTNNERLNNIVHLYKNKQLKLHFSKLMTLKLSIKLVVIVKYVILSSSQRNIYSYYMPYSILFIITLKF